MNTFFLQKDEWKNIDADVFALYTQYFTNTIQKVSEYSFLGIYIWRELYSLEYMANEELFFLREHTGDYWAPIGDWNIIDWSFYRLPEMKATFRFVPEALASLWKSIYTDTIVVTEDKASWDYIYSAKELSELAGGKFAKKKNHFNHFIKNTPNYAVEHITKDSSKELLEAYTIWSATVENLTPVLEAEKKSICNVLEDWSAFPFLEGIVIIIDGEIASFAIGEALSEDIFVVQIEKSLQNHRGIYQAINKFFADALYSEGYTYINRCDDMGVLGLRKAKEGYNPVRYEKKYTVKFI